MKKTYVTLGLNATLLSVVLAACGGGGGGPTQGTIKGQVGFFDTSLSLSQQEAAQSLSPDVIPGHFLVKYRNEAGFSKQGLVQVAGKTLHLQRNLALSGVKLLAFDGATRAQTASVLAALRADPNVEYAQPDYMMYPMKTSNDPLLGFQWHYNSIKLQEAWDITTGSNVTVAVADTGILKGHPELAGKLLPGYDFATLTGDTPTGDGDSRDPDPEDTGSNDTTSYHGTHVAGTIAAATNNGAGVAGVSWGAKIVPVRVLGLAGGPLSDIMDGLLWAAGEPVAGVPANANPAQVINMSLGGKAICSDLPAYQALFDKLAAKGIIVVVAAGNSNADASKFSPASCGNVITVGSTGFASDRSTFSNFGTRVDVMAPGGEMAQDLNGDTKPDGVLSLGKDDVKKEFIHTFLQGTSMAAPHVAGVVALMKSVKPNLNYAEAVEILKKTATPLSNEQCRVANGCGAGLINAFKAVQMANSIPVPDFNVLLDVPAITLEAESSASATLHLNLTGGFAQPIDVKIEGVDAKLQATLVNLGSNKFRIDVKALADSAGNYTITVKANSGITTRTEMLSVQVKPTDVNAKGTSVIACAYTGNPAMLCDPNFSRFFDVAASGKVANYQISLSTSRRYIPVAWLDKNGSGKLDGGDFWGFYERNGKLVLVDPGESGIDLPLELFHDIKQLGVESEASISAQKILEQMIQQQAK
ncbi:S8 family peptidase [Deinococcus roseus]|uniref:Serine protease n=1 Tax=Deinococcus roseus TaxID=392414 RepID=A0ABQ2CTV0_9DEIO|nr:S8 family peptidase [Deinococcus roseus]GGJ19683.1 serine protease [Deinococcus roseus]